MDDGEGGIEPQEEEREEREVQEVAMEVLEDERELRLHRVAVVDPGLPHRAAGRIGEVEAVVRLAVVVAGRPEAERDPQDEETGADPRRQPVRGDLRGEQRREEPGLGLVGRPEERGQEDAADEQVRRADREHRALNGWCHPPAVAPPRCAKTGRGGPAWLVRDPKGGGQPGHRAALTPASRSMTASAKAAVPARPPRSEVVALPSAITSRTAVSTPSAASG